MANHVTWHEGKEQGPVGEKDENVTFFAVTERMGKVNQAKKEFRGLGEEKQEHCGRPWPATGQVLWKDERGRQEPGDGWSSEVGCGKLWPMGQIYRVACFLFSLFLIFFYQNIVGLPCCGSFWYTTKWFSSPYVLFFRFFSFLGYCRILSKVPCAL